MKRARKGFAFLLPFFFLLSLLYFLFPSSSVPSHRSDSDALAPMEVVADGFKELRGVAVDDNDLIYVADREEGTVIRMEADQSKTVVASQLDRPTGLAFDLNGQLLIVERGAGRLLRLETDGSLTTVAEGMREPRWVQWRGMGRRISRAGGLSQTEIREVGETEVGETKSRGEQSFGFHLVGSLQFLPMVLKGLEESWFMGRPFLLLRKDQARTQRQATETRETTERSFRYQYYLTARQERSLGLLRMIWMSP